MKPTFETVLEELQAALARAAQAEVREAELRKMVSVARGALETIPLDALGSGWTPEGQEYPIRDELIYNLTKALASPSPVAEAMGRVVEGADDLVAVWPREEIGLLSREIRVKLEELVDAVDALQAARSRREEEPTHELDTRGEEGNH